MTRRREREEGRGGKTAGRGFTLWEVLIVAACCFLILFAVYRILSRSLSVSDETSRTISLQIGVRSFLGYLVQDVRQAHCFMTLADGDPEKASVPNKQVCVVRYRGTDALARVNRNVGGLFFGPKLQTYPFVRSSNIVSGEFEKKATHHETPAYQCIFTYDAAKGIITRIQREGLLVERNHPKAPYHLVTFEFKATEGKTVKKVLCSDVKTLDLAFLAYKRPKDSDRDDDAKAVACDGDLVEVSTLEAVDVLGTEKFPIHADTFRLQQTACLVVHVKTVFDKGLYGEKPAEQVGKDRRAPQVEVFTKIWSVARMRNELHKTHFGSMDADLRF